MPEKDGIEPGDIFHAGGQLGFLLVHRLGATPLDFEYVAGRLSQAGHTVLCPMLFGHGGSRTLLGATNWQQWYQSVRRAQAVLQQHCRHLIVGGLSAGASLSLLLAADEPDRVAGVVLFAPAFIPSGWGRPWYAPALFNIGHKGLANLFRLDEVAPYGIKDGELRQQSIDRMLADGRSRADVFARPGGALLEAHWLAAQITAHLATIRQPALIFHAREDDRTEGSSAYTLQGALGGITDVVVLEDSYHLVTADRQRDFVVERTLEFAGQVLAGPIPPPEGPDDPLGTEWRTI